MKKFKSFVALSLVVAMVLSLNVMFNGFASPTGGLNGDTCLSTNFDKSVYDVITYKSQMTTPGQFQWPKSGTVLIAESGTNWTLSKFNGITIPAGLVVDIYKYYTVVSADLTQLYVLLGHFDTTDGKPYTIGSDTDKNAATYSPKANTSCDATKWGTVTKSIVPGTPKSKYDSAGYVDVASDSTYYDAVMTLTDNGIVGGYGDGTFKPDDTITNGQILAIRTVLDGVDMTPRLYDTADRDGYQPFRDGTVATRAFTACIVAGDAFRTRPSHANWLTNYERSLVTDSYGLTKGTEGIYENMMNPAIYDAWRGSIGKNIKYLSSIDQFADAADIHKWIDENADFISKRLAVSGSHETRVNVCERYFLCAYNLGMFGTDADGNFDPYGTVTRAQFCQALYDIGWTYKGCLDYDACY